MAHDYGLIAASFAQQYGIRLEREEIALPEYLMLLKGLAADTPLARTIAIRSEKNPAIIKKFGAQERLIRREWRSFVSKNQAGRGMNDGEWQAAVFGLQQRLLENFGG